MNADRRKAIEVAKTKLETLQATYDQMKLEAEELVGMLETIRDEEQEYFDGMPESFQSGDKGQKAESAVTEMETAIEAVTEMQDFDVDIEGAFQALDSAAE